MDRCYLLLRGELTLWEREFVSSVRGKDLSTQQKKCLDRIWEKYFTAPTLSTYERLLLHEKLTSPERAFVRSILDKSHLTSDETERLTTLRARYL